ncbi:TonB-dependent receptor plug domain-containing protein [Sphingobacterium sp. Mn56C]|uniref:TonB-dependent receptor plug domain-containing protein n=1 Tax=Sphingobacterium sp. Mn56C TaxID=3395261 RepID=UPI003BB9B344
MQIIKFCALYLFLGLVWTAQAQQNETSILGKVLSAQGEAVHNPSVKLNGKSIPADAAGNFVYLNSKEGTVTLNVSAVGYQTYSKTLTVRPGKNAVEVRLLPDEKAIEQVKVLGLTKVQEVNKLAFNVTAIDATKLYNTTLDIAGALNKTAGIKVRESGGVGSNFNLSLNGFSGNHVRVFIDGIPMDNMGTAFQINNIPINLADRVEVYKGVVPIWLGSDALGGAINIISGNRSRTYVDASYSYGSFNTHRSVINTAVTSKNGFTIQLNAFQNYADNNYKVSIPAYENRLDNFQRATKVKRFNDTYHNETVIANLGVVDKPYADKLLVGVVLGKDYKEIQTGARMQSVFGERHRRGSLVMPTLKYSKTDLIKGLDVQVTANLNLGWSQNIDTANRRYDWFGVTTVLSPTSGEAQSKTRYKFRNNEGIVTSMAKYSIGQRQEISLNNVFTTFNRKGSDPLNPTNAEYEKTKKTQKNILGLGYIIKANDQFDFTVFGKLLTQNLLAEGLRDEKMNRLGYGAAASYFINPQLQVKASYELTNRLATNDEIFGDLEIQAPNPNLKPESSNNVNAGLAYNFNLASNHHFRVNSNLIYRYAHNFIFTRFESNQARIIADNRDGVRTWGVDADIRYSYKNFISAGGNITYQYLQNMQKIEPDYTGISPVYKDQMPNIPYLFANADVSVFFRNVGRPDNNLNIGYNLMYMNKFYLYWPSRGGRAAEDEKRGIPNQLSHDINMVYSLAKGKYNIALEARNITDELLVDNFSLQKPGRAFYVKLRYFFSKK